MKYLSVEKRCELIVDAYHSISKEVEKPLLIEKSSKHTEYSYTNNYGVFFNTDSRTRTSKENQETYKYEYKGKQRTFEDSVKPYIDSISDFKAGEKGVLIIFKNRSLLEHVKKHGKAELYDLVQDVTVVEYDFTDVVISEFCDIDLFSDSGCLSLDGQPVLDSDGFRMTENISKEFLVDLHYLLKSANSRIKRGSRHSPGIRLSDWILIAEDVARVCPNMRVSIASLDMGGTYEYKDVCGQRSWVERTGNDVYN